MALVDAVVAFVANLVVGSVAIHIAAEILTEEARFEKAVFTAIVGALVWGLVAFFFGGIPFLGPLLALLAWVAVINWQYPGGWINAASIAVVAWVSALAVIYLLTLIGVGSLQALGIPGA